MPASFRMPHSTSSWFQCTAPVVYAEIDRGTNIEVNTQKRRGLGAHGQGRVKKEVLKVQTKHAFRVLCIRPRGPRSRPCVRAAVLSQTPSAATESNLCPFSFALLCLLAPKQSQHKE